MSGVPREITWAVDSKGCHVCTSHKPGSSDYPIIERLGRRGHMHRLLYEQRHGLLASGVVVRHTCDNRMCINDEHLIPGSQADNVRDKVERGRGYAPKWDERSDTKLSDKDVEAIRSSRDSQASLAKRFRINQSTVSRIRARKRRLRE